jgi:LPPG:FO 2-phospho-L-lactate transferase
VTGRVVALSGGVGGAKLALGLARVLGPDELVVVANTGDDFVHLGLAISPDVDTLLYTLAGLADPVRGWGLRNETWTFMAALERLGGDTWFRLGDADLALHVERTRRLAAGANLTDVTDALRHRLDIGARILPMSDDPVRTRLRTDAGWLDFQDYFVRHRCEPVIREIAFEGARVAAASPAVLEALRDPALRAVVVCPSNPLLSVAPMLAIPALRAALCDSPASVVAVSPVIAGEAVKGPTAKLLRELGHESSAAAVARAYVDFVDVFVVDERDAATSVPPGMRLVTAQTLMASIEDRERLARAVLAAADAH